MLKREITEIPTQPKPKSFAVFVQVSEEMHKEIHDAARELRCSVSEYFRRLHKFAQE